MSRNVVWICTGFGTMGWIATGNYTWFGIGLVVGLGLYLAFGD